MPGLVGEHCASVQVCQGELMQIHIFMGNKSSWFVFGDRITLITEKCENVNRRTKQAKMILLSPALWYNFQERT